MLQLRNPPILCRVGDVFELAIPIVLAFDEGTTVELATFELDGDNMSFSFVQQLDRNAKTFAHGEDQG